MDYSYNYNYLKDFMYSHHLCKRDLLEALGCSDYTSLNKWLDGKVPVHVTALLRFCNYYNVPLSNFFVDGDGMPCDFAPLMPGDNAQLLPTDGYGIKEGRGRGIVETRIQTRVATSPEQAQAVAQGLKAQAEQRARREAAIAELRRDEAPATTTQPQDKAPSQQPDNLQLAETVLRMKLDHSNEIRQLEQAHRDKEDSIRLRYDNERDRLMAIIEQQAREIVRLSSPMKMNTYSQGDHGSISIAAEGDIDNHNIL